MKIRTAPTIHLSILGVRESTHTNAHTQSGGGGPTPGGQIVIAKFQSSSKCWCVSSPVCSRKFFHKQACVCACVA